MVQWILKKIVGSKNQRLLRRMRPLIDRINELEQQLQSEPEENLRKRTFAWKRQFEPFHDPEFLAGVALRQADEEALKECCERVAGQFEQLREHFPQIDPGPVRQASDPEAMREALTKARAAFEAVEPKFFELEQKMLDDILPEAFAVVKNGARRLCGSEIVVCDQPMNWEMVHFDVQLIGGIALHQGKIAEMATGEGKTLVATLAVYLNALAGRGVHVVTVNDYLARRDSEWMGALFKYLGLTVGCIQNHINDPAQRREQYNSDITYGTNSEFGFDYLRDNGMATSKRLQVQRGHAFAIIDEVDSVLIDEARTPLIISGPVTSSTHEFDRYKPLVSQLVKKQAALANKLVQEAQEKYKEGDLHTAGRLLYQIKMGHPKNRAFLRMMEDPDQRRLVEKSELDLYRDPQKTELFELKEGLFYAIEEKNHSADLTDQGRSFLDPNDPEAFMLPDLATAFGEIDADRSLTGPEREKRKQEMQEKLDAQGRRIHHITQLLKAFCVYEKDVHYVVSNNKVVIVDEHTGREMPGRRWADGLHQAVEAKEGVQIDKETQTLATITIQNYFRLYSKLAGMTGTAETEAAEFHDIYRLDVLVVPTNRPVRRVDHNDSIYRTRREKYNAVIETVRERHARGQPLLIGTASVEASETLARMLRRQQIPHAVLNAKNHRQEAEIVARAGQKGSVTVSTNMAGRGTDIKLGEGVAELGGLCVVATERHESRRIDRQLRGRCARQGDPGESKFFLSFEDDLMRNFGAAERMTKIMDRFGLEEGQELEHPWLNRSVETAQKRVEQRNYIWRKRILEYDDVMNQQREVVYAYRNEVLETPEPRDLILEAIERGIPTKVHEFMLLPDAGDQDDDVRDLDGLVHWVNSTFPLRLSRKDDQLDDKEEEAIIELLIKRVKDAYLLKTEHEDPNALEGLERYIILNAIDRLWQEHLYAMDALKEGVHLRSYGQRDPVVEYKREAYDIFQGLMDSITQETLTNLFRNATSLKAFETFLANLQIKQRRDAGLPGMPGMPMAGSMTSTGGGMAGAAGAPAMAGVGGGGEGQGEAAAGGQPTIKLPVRREVPKVGRNDPCPCGSGKKYKNCCGRAG